MLAAMLMAICCTKGAAQSPSINADNSVKFTVRAPQAQLVQVDLGGTKYPMQKAEDGTWRVTTKPQVPGFHYYSLIIDGVSVADPASPSFYGCSRWSSAIEIPEAGMDDFEMQGVPHGDAPRVEAPLQRQQAAAMVERLVEDPSAKVDDIVLKPVKIVERMSTAAFATDDQQILKALLFIHKNALKKISVSDVMAEAALSRRLLERRFKAVTGKTLYEYITDQKLRYFAEQLEETDEQVINIALSMGENDTKSISRRFKQLYGCTPMAWRDKQRKNKL